MGFELFQFSDGISEEALKSEVISLNNNPNISGYIIQLPLPPRIDPLRIIRNIDPKKDVDGFHPENIGKIMI
jgi:methylenetetrahydrofolate dehydrogenase (NADP+)/methenyltetrahydrofolate cyclohydrolase